ncbi:MAG: hypothetical protein IJU98_09620, partial [Synergistaceae bacterium]|nr:hypothetical protein [Synergistaceae bacterium]
DGKDELVFLTPSYMTGDNTIGEGGTVLVSVWGMDGSLSPSRKFWRSAYLYIYGYGGVSGTDMAECSYLPRSISLALVPVGDKLSDGAFTRRVFISKSQGDDEVQKASNYGAGDYVGYLTPQISGGSVTGLADIVRHSGGGAGRALGLLPGDFYCQTVELGEPDHMVFEDERSYAAEIQTPPYHVDYVQVPFAVNGAIPAKPSVLNMSYMGSNVVYSKSQTDSEKSDVSFKTTSTLDWGASANATVPLIGTTLSGGYKDTATNVQNATSSSEAKTTLTLTDATDATDIAMLYKTDRHVWRYPVISAAPGRPEGSNGDAFMTFSLCDTPTTAHGAIGQSSQFDDYNPIHEEGNLFSYPTKVENIPCYSQRQYDLTAEQQKTTGGNTTIDLAVSETHADTNGTTTTSKKVVNGSASVSIPIPKVLNIGASATASYANELTDTTTFTKSYLSSEKFTVNLRNGALGFGSEKVAHDIKTQLYADAAGVMKVGFAVDLKSTAGDTAEVWQEGGMYYGKSDPALVLPAKYTRFTSVVDNVTRVVWSANTNRKSAIQLRGIWFRDENDKVVSPALVRGKKYTIEVPVYNASFKAPAQDVKIAMQLRTLGATASEDKVVVGDAGSRTFSIGGWTKDTESNKATVTFDWTVPSSVEKGNYHLYFVLDPENVIDELHEDWDAAKDPGGNNVGCYPVAILETEPAAYTTDAGVSVASVAEDDFRMLLREPGTEDGEWISLAQFRDELSGMDEDFRAHAKIIYSGADTLTNMYLDVVRVDPDGSEVRVASRIVPALFPNTEYEVSFMVSPEKASAGTFGASLSGSGTSLRWGKAEGGNGGGSGGSSGGCRTGTANGLILLLAATFPALMKKKAK